MTHMTRVEAEALAAFITRARPEWRQAGIVAALEKAAPTADVWDLARALINLAADTTVLTPGLLPGPGPHWRKPDGSMTGRRGDHDVRCVDHTDRVMPCGHPDHSGDMTPDEIAAQAAAIRASLPHPAAPRRRGPGHATDHARLDAARARMDSEDQP